MTSNVLQVASVIFIVFAAIWVIVGSVFSSRLFHPLLQLEALAKDFMDGKLLHPLEEPIQQVYEFEQLGKILHKAFTLAQEKSVLENQLNQVAARLAHDITSPVMGLKLLIEQIPGLTEEQREFLAQGSKQIDEMTRNFLAQYRATRDKKTAVSMSKDLHGRVFAGSAKYPIEIATIIEQVVELGNIKFAKNKIHVILDIANAARQALVCVDKMQLERILSNLFNNSVDAILSSKREQGVIDVSLEKHNNFLALTVRDNGCGMASELIKKIGINEYSEGKNGGTGLGLYSAIQYIKGWNGDYKITSQLGKGTSFVIYIPLA